MRLSHPRRVELGAESYDEQRRKSFNSVHRPTEHFQTRRVDPMRIFDDHQHRLLSCQSRELCRQRFQRSLPALFRGQLKRGIASIIRERQHLGKERGILGRGRGLRQQSIELVELRLRFVVVHQAGGAFHLADDRIKRAVRVLRRAEIAQARVRLGGEAFQQRGREPRFADARLARQQYHLAFAGLGSATSAAAAIRILLPARRERSGRSRAAPRSGFPPSSPAAPPRRAPVRRCP